MRLGITGHSVLSAIGASSDEFWSSLTAGLTGIGPLRTIDTSPYPSRLGAEIPRAVLESAVNGKGLRKYDRIQLLTLGAARMAWHSARLDESRYDPEELGIVLGSTLGYIESVTSFYSEALRDGPAYVSPLAFANTVMNAPAGKIAIEYKLTGLCSTIASGETSGLDALAYARDAIRHDQCAAVLVGAGNALCDATYLGYQQTNMLSGGAAGGEQRCIPFDERADGIILGDGAAMVVLETYERAARDGVPIAAELLGCSGRFVVERDNRQTFATAVAQNMSDAIAEAGLEPSDIGLVSAAANSDPYQDLVEADAIAEVFGEGGAAGPMVTAIKSMTGECLDAASLLQTVAGIYALNQNTVPPILDLDRRYVIRDINFATRSEERAIDHVLISAISCSGQVAAVVIGPGTQG